MPLPADPETPRPAASVGIVIPCFNYARYLAEAVTSALAQTCTPSRVVVVDDGSTDDTPAVASRLTGIEYVRTENLGLSHARNVGVQQLATEFVVFLDADDRLRPEYLERCLHRWRETEAAYVYTQALEFGLGDSQTSAPEFDVGQLLKGNYINASALLPTDLVRRFPYDETLRSGSEDWDFYLTLHESGYYGALLDEPLLEYRKHEGGMVRALRARPLVLWLTTARIGWRHREAFGGARGVGRRLARDASTILRDFNLPARLARKARR